MMLDRRAYMKAYNQRPEVEARKKAYMKAYNQRPEVKAHIKAYGKVYYQRPEVKAHIKAYHQRPEVKAHNKVYNQRPEVKARKTAYAKEYQRHRRQDPAIIISDSRRQYEQLCDKDPKEARELLTELEQTEGKDFRELLLDGIPEKKLIDFSGGEG